MMNIELKKISIRELTKNYNDNSENGITAYDGKLDVRPPYQREFVYNEKQRNAVIHTVKQDFPLNVMSWASREDGTFEIIDGQQRTISICQYVNGDFAYEMRYFHNLTNDEKKQILDYELMVYICTGSDSQKLQWFETINIAGEKLTKQELRNAVYSGSWLSDAKRYFSKNGCPNLMRLVRIIWQVHPFGKNIYKLPLSGYHNLIYQNIKEKLKAIWQFISMTPMHWHCGSIFKR